MKCYGAISSLPYFTGNYNNHENDDFMGKDGRLYYDAAQFGNTWLVGGADCRVATQKGNESLHQVSMV